MVDPLINAIHESTKSESGKKLWLILLQSLSVFLIKSPVKEFEV
jgi:hypothetical protein